jgi:hypothetical protein
MRVPKSPIAICLVLATIVVILWIVEAVMGVIPPWSKRSVDDRE